MKPNPHPAPDDGQTDRLLARRYRDTTPEFEARWTALKRDLRQPPVRARKLLPWRLTGWLGAVGAAAAVALMVHLPRSPEATTDEVRPSPALAELFAMEAVLSRAAPLLDEENRTALLHLPAPGQPPN